MRIESNILGVIGRMERMAGSVDPAMKEALDKRRWDGLAPMTARKVLTAIATAEQRKFIEPFLETIGVTNLTGEEYGLSLTMHAPAMIREQAQTAAQASEDNRSLGITLADESQNRMQDVIRQWVERGFTDREDPGSGKEIKAGPGQQDYNMSDDDITRKLSWILFGAPAGPKVDAARAGLMKRLETFMRAVAAGVMTPETITEWLLAVLGAWGEMVRAQWRAGFRQEFRRLRRELVWKSETLKAESRKGINAKEQRGKDAENGEDTKRR